jgi:3-hydroxyisobutyrate dehydrogenase/2-hydroxy-3-oxopropionate reductase
VPVPLTAITRQMFQASISKGHGDQDICATIKVLEDLAGVEVRGGEAPKVDAT